MKLFDSKKKKLVAASVMAVAIIGGGAVAANAAGGTGCKYLTYPLCARSVASVQIVDGSIIENDLNATVRAKLNKVGSGAQGPAGPAGPQGPAGPAGKDGKDGDPASDVFGKQGGTLTIPETAIEKIGGPFASNATKVGEFTLPKGTWLINAAVMFDRTDANDPDYQAPTTDTMPQFVLRYPDDAGTIMGNAISRAGYTELTGSSVRTITLDADTKITAYGFGYNEDRSNFGSATADAKSQFSVTGSVTAVRVG